MTSWERGRENEQTGQQEEREGELRGDVGQQIRGAARDLSGKVEQGVDNLGDTLTGRQDDLEGDQHNYGRDAQNWVNDRANDAQRATDNAGNDIRNAADRAGDWVRERGEDADRKLD